MLISPKAGSFSLVKTLQKVVLSAQFAPIRPHPFVIFNMQMHFGKYSILAP